MKKSKNERSLWTVFCKGAKVVIYVELALLGVSYIGWRSLYCNEENRYRLLQIGELRNRIWNL